MTILPPSYNEKASLFFFFTNNSWKLLFLSFYLTNKIYKL